MTTRRRSGRSQCDPTGSASWLERINQERREERLALRMEHSRAWHEKQALLSAEAQRPRP